MGKSILAAGLCLAAVATVPAWAEQPLDPAAKPSPPSPLQRSRPLRPGAPRWLENYRFLADPQQRTDPWDRIRYLPFGQSSWLQIGGEARLRVDGFINNPGFGLRGVDSDTFYEERALIHGDAHLFDDRMRVYVELGDTRAQGKKTPYTTIERTGTELHQAFVDANLTLGDGRLTLRGGRQELSFGAQRLVTVRDAPNVRLVFDGVRAIYQHGMVQTHVFAARPVINAPDNFSDHRNHAALFYGVYSTIGLDGAVAAPATGVDLYAFGRERDQASFDGIVGRERRYTTGTRLFGKRAGFDWDVELAYQFGTLGPADIRAYAFASDSGYTFDQRWKPRLGLRLDVASGDSRTGDDRAGTFDPLYPRNGFYGDASLAALANLRLYGPSFRLQPMPALTLNAELLRMTRQDTGGAAFTPGPAPVPGTLASETRNLGNMYKLDAQWLATTNITVTGEYIRYDVAGALRQAGAGDVDYYEMRIGYRF